MRRVAKKNVFLTGSSVTIVIFVMIKIFLRDNLNSFFIPLSFCLKNILSCAVYRGHLMCALARTCECEARDLIRESVRVSMLNDGWIVYSSKFCNTFFKQGQVFFFRFSFWPYTFNNRISRIRPVKIFFVFTLWPLIGWPF